MQKNIENKKKTGQINRNVNSSGIYFIFTKAEGKHYSYNEKDYV